MSSIKQMITDEQIKEVSIEGITRLVGKKFTCFGGGNTSEWNPLMEALKDYPLQFAAGVSVADVVRFVINKYDN